MRCAGLEIREPSFYVVGRGVAFITNPQVACPTFVWVAWKMALVQIISQAPPSCPESLGNSEPVHSCGLSRGCEGRLESRVLGVC